MSETRKSIKVLQVLVCLGGGGVEARLLELHRHLPEHIQFDYLVHHADFRDKEAIELGATVHVLPDSCRFPTRWAGHIGRLVAEHRYDAVHFRRFAFGGEVLRQAKKNGAVVRISQSHHTMFQEPGVLKKILYYPYHWTVNRVLLALYATEIIGVSRKALRFSMGPLSGLRKCRVVLNKIDVDSFSEQAASTDRGRLCQRYGIPEDAIVIGSFGRLEPVKNQLFLLDVFQRLAERDSRYILFLGGEGGLRKTLEARVRELNLEDRVFLPGQCENPAGFYVHLFDAFVLPSLAEGFGTVILEAIAAGLIAVYADTVPRDIFDTFPSRVEVLSLRAKPEEWADRLEEAVRKKRSFEGGIEIIREARMTTDFFVREMVELYEKACETES